MRRHPIGTGPFKFVSYRPNESIKLVRNEQYWKPERPYLDGIEWTIIANRSTALLAFAAGKFDMTFPFGVSVPLMKQVQKESPDAICDLEPANQSTNLIVNRDAPPFDKPEIRRAMVLALDRKSFIDILTEGHGDIGGAMQPAPEGVWGMPDEILKTIPGYGPDVAKNRAEAREIMEKAGYGPEKRLTVKVSVRNTPPFRDPAVVLIDQLREIYIDGELETIESANWFPKVYRKDYKIGLNLTGAGVDDPDAQFYENYACGSDRNYTGYCNAEINSRFDKPSMERDQEKRRRLVWDMDRKLQEDGARPILFHNRFATCLHPQVKGLTIMVNSLFNGWRMEDVWLEKNLTPLPAAEESSRPGAAEKPALVPPSALPGDTRAGGVSAEPPTASAAAPAPRDDRAGNPPKSAEPQPAQQALQPEQRRITHGRHILRDDAREHARRERVRRPHSRHAFGQQTCAPSERAVDFEGSLILKQCELEMVGRMDGRVDTERRAARGARVRKVNVLAQRPVDAHRRDVTGRTDPHEVIELPPADDDVAGTRPIVHVPEPHEPAHPRLKEHVRLNTSCNERAGLVGLVIDLESSPLHRDDPFRPKRPSAESKDFAVPDLWHKSRVGAEAAGEVLVQPEPVDMRGAVVPERLGCVAAQALAVPLVGHTDSVRCAALAEENLSRDDVCGRRPPLEVGPNDPIVPFAVAVFAGRDEHADDRHTSVSSWRQSAIRNSSDRVYRYCQ